MSDTSAAPPSSGLRPAPASPPARRSTLPSWLDVRLGLGVLLVIVSVLLGARVVAAADHTVQVWGVTGDLSAGTTLTGADVVPVRVRLDDAGQYLRTSASPSGRTLNRLVGRGELLPAAALGATPDGQLVSLPVSSAHAPQDLGHGDVIDVFATTSRSTTGGASTTRILSGVTVQSVRRPTSGLAGSAGDQLAVVVRVAAADAGAVVAALNNATLDVTVVLGGSASGTGAGTAPSARPSTSPGAVPSGSSTP